MRGGGDAAYLHHPSPQCTAGQQDPSVLAREPPTGCACRRHGFGGGGHRAPRRFVRDTTCRWRAAPPLAARLRRPRRLAAPAAQRIGSAPAARPARYNLRQRIVLDNHWQSHESCLDTYKYSPAPTNPNRIGGRSRRGPGRRPAFRGRGCRTSSLEAQQLLVRRFAELRRGAIYTYRCSRPTSG